MTRKKATPEVGYVDIDGDEGDALWAEVEKGFHGGQSGYQQSRYAFRRGFAHAQEERKALLELVELQDRLLVAYRLGRHPGERVLDGITKVKAKLAELTRGKGAQRWR